MHRYPPPPLHDVLLPVIACLPTAFFSPHPPPAFLPLLSPILRQRVSLLSQSTISQSDPDDQRTTSQPNLPNRDHNWLNLLTWRPDRASRLLEICSNLNLEPHPVSGELELFEDEDEEHAGKIEYRRLDPETLHAKCDVRKHDISVVWIWCTNDNGAVGVEALTGGGASDGKVEDGWRVAEVRPVEGTENETWYATQGEAEEAFASHSHEAGVAPTTAPSISTSIPADEIERAGTARSEASDDYWAAYDRTPGRTPGKESPAPQSSQNQRSFPPGLGMTALTTDSKGGQQLSADESEYFSRYGSEVQPALDSHDPEEEEGTGQFESTLRPQQGQGTQQRQQQPPTPPFTHHDKEATTSADPLATTISNPQTERRIHSPQPSRGHSPGGSPSNSPVNRLEDKASASTAAEVGVKQHISTEMKSLYRLAKAAGIEREEFERVVRTELGVLDLMEEVL